MVCYPPYVGAFWLFWKKNITPKGKEPLQIYMQGTDYYN